MFDTQLIRNAYLNRPVETLDMPFGAFACQYLGVQDKWLEHEHNPSVVCNYIIKMNYNVVKEV